MYNGARKWWALGALTLAILAIGLDATVLSVALPTLAGALNASTSDLQWFVSSYTLALAVGLLPGGLLGDRYGRKKILLSGLVVFAASSVACAYSPSAGAFIAARTILGLSAAFVIPLSLSVLTVLFSEAERPRAVGVWAGANFIALPIGPIVGGWLLSNFWWGWVFLMNLPVVAVGVAAAVVLVPESRSEEPPALDLSSLAASVAGLALTTYGFIRAGQNGWLDTGAISAIIGGILVLVFFVWWQMRLKKSSLRKPLVDPSLFSSRGFTWGTVLVGIGGFAIFGVLFTAPQFFQAIMGTDAMGSGIRLLPLMGGLIVGVVTADRVASKIGAKFAAAIGFIILTGGLIIGTATGVSSGDAFIALWTAMCGAGMGLALATSASAVLVELPEEEAGVGSAVFQAIQKVGAPLSAAILGSALNSTYQSHVDLAGLPAQTASTVKDSVFAGLKVAYQMNSVSLANSVKTAFTQGVDATLWVSSGLAAVSVLLTLIFLPRRITAVEKQSVENAKVNQNAIS